MKLIITALLFSMTTVAFAQSNQMRKEALAIGKLIKVAKELAEVDLSCNQDTDCIVVEYGKMACGGPGGGIILSEKNLNALEVKFLAQSSVEKEASFIQRWRINGICMVQRLPQANCVRNICQDSASEI